MEKFPNHKILVLNSDYQAISVVSLKRGFQLVFGEKAETIETSKNTFLRSEKDIWPAPTVIRIKKYVKVPMRGVPLNRLNIFRRDGFSCLYCGSKKELTLDHVLPRSRGGGDSWKNLATCCGTCNLKKGDRTPEEAKMPLRHEPYRPSFIMYIKNLTNLVEESWKPYIYLA